MLWLFVLGTSLFNGEAAIVMQKWEVKYAYSSPDCYKKLALTINGLIPGPVIEAVEGDTVVVEVTNGLFTENVAIHWHGIRQKGTPWFDGTEGVTQCPIQPRETFVYKFVVDRAGTYLYHAHYGAQLGQRLYGMIRVKTRPGVVEPFKYSSDEQILLTDWYHANSNEESADLSSVPFVWVGEPDSILIQGKGKFDCNKPGTQPTLCNATNPQCSPYVLKADPGKTIRLRLGSLTSLSSLSFEIEGHEMTVVAADGHYVEPFTVKHLYIYSGETYSVLINATQDPTKNYWMVAKVVAHQNKTKSALAILNYSPNSPSNPTTSPPEGPMWNDTPDRIRQSLQIKAHHDFIVRPPKTSYRKLLLLNSQSMINGQVKWSVNNVALNLPRTPYLIALKHKMYHAFNQKSPPETYDFANFDIHNASKAAVVSDGIYRLKFNSVVDVVLQNSATFIPQNNSETHPWHLHGHDFWVLAQGRGKFDPSNDTKHYNLDNPIMKNTVPVHPYGWTALRFRADNPGVWAFHCHVESHFFMGMALVFEEGIHKVGKLPKSIMGCGDSKGLR